MRNSSHLDAGHAILVYEIVNQICRLIVFNRICCLVSTIAERHKRREAARCCNRIVLSLVHDATCASVVCFEPLVRQSAQASLSYPRLRQRSPGHAVTRASTYSQRQAEAYSLNQQKQVQPVKLSLGLKANSARRKCSELYTCHKQRQNSFVLPTEKQKETFQ